MREYGVNSIIDMIRTGYEDKENVLPPTVGQYTGLKDKNGVKIFEGDIILRRYTTRECGLISKKHLVVFGNGAFKLHDVSYMHSFYKNRPEVLKYVNLRGFLLYHDYATFEAIRKEDPSYDGHYLIIGNIHDNPNF